MSWAEVSDDPVIARIGYDSRTRTLEVAMHAVSPRTLHDGIGVYRYLDVPAPVLRGLLTAESPVGFFCTRIVGTYRQDR